MSDELVKMMPVFLGANFCMEEPPHNLPSVLFLVSTRGFLEVGLLHVADRKEIEGARGLQIFVKVTWNAVERFSSKPLLTRHVFGIWFIKMIPRIPVQSHENRDSEI